jgi:hypothetical protein
MSKLRSEHIVLCRDGFCDLTIRRWNYEDGTHSYDMLCYTYRNGDTRWQKINLSNEEIEKQIKLYKRK